MNMWLHSAQGCNHHPINCMTHINVITTSDINEATTLRGRGQDPRGQGRDPRGRGQDPRGRGQGKGQVFRPQGRGQIRGQFHEAAEI